MIEIPLTQGKIALIDDEDYELISVHKWRLSSKNKWFLWYALTKLVTNTGRIYTTGMHRLIMGLDQSDKRHVDHVNHNGLDNRRSNLRIATCSQNHYNIAQTD